MNAEIDADVKIAQLRDLAEVRKQLPPMSDGRRDEFRGDLPETRLVRTP